MRILTSDFSPMFTGTCLYQSACLCPNLSLELMDLSIYTSWSMSTPRVFWGHSSTFMMFVDKMSSTEKDRHLCLGFDTSLESWLAIDGSCDKMLVDRYLCTIKLSTHGNWYFCHPGFLAGTDWHAEFIRNHHGFDTSCLSYAKNIIIYQVWGKRARDQRNASKAGTNSGRMWAERLFCHDCPREDRQHIIVRAS